MPSLLHNIPITDQQRRENDAHRPAVVVAVLAVLCVYMYLFTYISDPLGIPRPQELVESLGLGIDHVFDDDRNVDSNIGIPMAQRFEDNDNERLVLFLSIIAAFLCAYFFPLRYKQPALVFWTLLAISILYGINATAGLLLAHVIVYLVLHPGQKYSSLLSASAGILGYVAFMHEPGGDWSITIIGLSAIAIVLYRFGLLRLLQNRSLAVILRSAVVHSAILAIGLSVLSDAIYGDDWSLPLGLLLFFWQWARLTMYYIDYKDGLVPKDVTFDQYLAIFLNPGTIANWNWGVTIPQGYAYVTNNFLCEDKNKLVLAGLKLLVIALGYLVFWSWIRHFLVDVFTDLGISVHGGNTKRMVRHFMRGQEIGTASVLATTFLDLVRFMMFFAGVVHFKVGIWRICGYRIDPYYNRPWLATNLMTFWTRFAFHYREFLVRAFYYPVFFRFFKRRKNLRIFVASMAAAAVGNMIWHFTERVFFNEMDLGNIYYVIGTWPYFFFLGLGIAVSQITLLRRKRTRKPWTRDRWIFGDIVAAYMTLQYFALIHIFARPASDSTVSDLFRLFLRGLGIFIEA